MQSFVLCCSNSDPSQVVFGGEVVGESAVQFEQQIGPEVVHTYEVLNVDDSSMPPCAMTNLSEKS